MPQIKGCIPWNKGKTLENDNRIISRSGYRHSEVTKKKISIAQIGKKLSKEHRINIGKAVKKLGIKPPNWLGKKHSTKSKNKISVGNKGKKRTIKMREDMSVIKKLGTHWNWKGGISSVNSKIRQSLEYKLWQDSVKNRDNNRCQKCEENRISKVMAHHILNFSKYPELRFAIDNGITFCRPCHKEFHKIYSTRNNTYQQVTEFIK